LIIVIEDDGMRNSVMVDSEGDSSYAASLAENTELIGSLTTIALALNP